MDRILSSITTDHDVRWLLGAALVCVLGLATAIQLLANARLQADGRRREMTLLAAIVSGLAVFTAHFIALQGYQPGSEIRYAVWPTIGSFALAVGSFGLAASIVMLRPTRSCRAFAAILALAGVSGMHFLGVSGLRLAGPVGWDAGLALLAVVGALILAVAAGGIVFGDSLARRSATAFGGSLAVGFLHLVAMSALRIGPGNPLDTGQTVSGEVMTGVIAVMGLAVVSTAAAVAWMSWAARSGALSQLHEAIEGMPDGLAFFDCDDRLVLWNTRYSEINPELADRLAKGLSFRDILQHGIDQALYAEALGREEAWLAERLAARRQLSNSLELQIAANRWLRIQDRRTEADGIVTVVTDITEQKRDAQALAEARDTAEGANRAKSQFLANMSHEIRTPLNGVMGVAQALALTDLTPQQREMLDLIHSSGQTLQVLLGDILDLARVESGRLELSEEPLDLALALRQSAQLYEASAHAKGLRLFLEIAPEVEGWVLGDVVRIKQILTNLVSNAVKFTGEGFVSLSAAPGPHRDGVPSLRISVEDTGIGFDGETRDRLFSRFEQADGAITRKFGGSGLGLSISRQLAVMMGGELDCESEPGGGSAFILTIPFRRVDAPVSVVPVVDDVGQAERGIVRVLLADDHPVNRKVVELILSQAPVELTSVEDGAQAVQACRDGDYDLILMDMQMPVMDGLTATSEIRLHEAAMGLGRTPIVMLTANALPEHMAAAEAAGADRHLAKPFDAAELLDLLVTMPAAARRLAA